MNQWWKSVCRVRNLGSNLPSYEPAAPWSFLFLLLPGLNWFLGLASFRDLPGMFLPPGSCTAVFLVQGVISQLSTGPAFILLPGLYSNAVASVSLPLPSCLQLSSFCQPQLPATSKSPVPASMCWWVPIHSCVFRCLCTCVLNTESKCCTSWRGSNDLWMQC